MQFQFKTHLVDHKTIHFTLMQKNLMRVWIGLHENKWEIAIGCAAG
jgi:hypothetical protein